MAMSIFTFLFVCCFVILPQNFLHSKLFNKSATKSMAPGALDFSKGEPQFSRLALFRSTTLEEKTGKLMMDDVKIINLPEKETNGNSANYDVDHKLQIVLSSLDREKANPKVIATVPATASLQNGVGNLALSKSSFELTSGGNYELKLVIDGKESARLVFFVKKGTKDGVTRYFLSEPWGLSLQLQVSQEGSSKSQMEAKFYHSIQTLDDMMGDDGKDSYAKLYDDDTESVLAAHLNTSGGRYSKRKWSALNMTFWDAENINSPYLSSKLLAKDGNYSIRLKFGKDGKFDEKYIYPFSVKSGKIVSRNDVNVVYDKDGYANSESYWIDGDVQGEKKTEGFVATAPTTGVKENIAFGIGNSGCRPPKACAVNDGDEVSLSDMILEGTTRDQSILKDLECTLTLKQGEKILAQHHWEQMCDDGGCNQILNDLVPKMSYSIYKNQSLDFVKAMADLPAGKQNLTLVCEINLGKNNKKVIGFRNFTFNSVAGNPKYKALIPNLEKRMSMTVQQFNEEFWEKYGGPQIVTFVNNCKMTVWLRKNIGSDKREYRLSSGSTMQYDLNDGYLQQWNFSTGKWGSIGYKGVTDGSKINICK